MSRIFLMLLVFFSIIGLSACNRTPATSTAQPKEIAAVTEPFFAAVRRGDQKSAEKYVAPGFLDDSKVQFAEMSALLKKSPRLSPVLQQRQATGYYLTYAEQDGAYWITSEVRLARYGQKHMIEYWDVNAAKKPPEIVEHVQTMRNVVNYGLIALGIVALAGLTALIWLVRNRTHLVTAAAVDETRKVAATVRNTDV